jgi:hypothetical protein
MWDAFGAELALVVRALTPSADVVFVPIDNASHRDLVNALDSLINTNIPVILLPFGQVDDRSQDVIRGSLQRIVATGHLVVVSAGEGFPTWTIAAQTVDLDGRTSGFTPGREEVLGAVGELPVVRLTEAGPTVFVGNFASAALAAVAVESIARQPTLRGAALRDALIEAATHPKDPKDPPVARVVIPR